MVARWPRPSELLAVLRAEATAILDEDRAMCESIGSHGLAFLPDGARVLTHCNAGALATAGIPVTILTDGMAASLMRQREIDIVLVGADRIAGVITDAGVHLPPYLFTS